MECDWEVVFDIVEENSRFYAVFKHSGEKLNSLSPCVWRVYAESLAYNWCHNLKNEKKVLDIVTELSLTGKE